MKNRLVAYGMIRKGSPERCMMVLLDERLCSRDSVVASFFQRRRERRVHPHLSLVRR